ncbi:MAG: siderophore-interacting protein [Salana multivorans]|uniref:siderophore-interacting protein n=1 Tax=Salana multivorans TaxID=120377 RepID=UPI000969E184|nr:siderophore-interacting protein [Salana multivorans]MBN8881496.1 siderophore-interacting protein [Salana multivorans]OJX94757.1 MAG: hypothetical protein BGO96_01445 [Micrococcales bacterium 73-15]
MTRRRPAAQARKPEVATVRGFRVVDALTISPGFRRVVVRNDDEDFDEEFSYLGYDHWFRLFLPLPGRPLELPLGGLDGWHQRLLAMPDEVRPIVRNYTIRAARRDSAGWELDVDFVLHRGASGEVEGEAAGWALACRPGDELGFLDQGCIFTAYDERPLLLVTDETGLPGVEAILATLDHDRVTTVVEVASEEDRRELAGPGASWTARRPGQGYGDAALEVLRGTSIDPACSAYIVGESAFVLRARTVCRRAGVAKEAIGFCGYWRL